MFDGFKIGCHKLPHSFGDPRATKQIALASNTVMATLHKTAIIASLLASTAGAQVPDSQIERFILENDYLLLKGVYPSKQTDESRAVTRRLQLLPPEAIDSALRLLSKGSEDYKGYRPQVMAFLEGMYRTHPVSDGKHRQVARAVFNEMVQPRGKHLNFGDMLFALHFFNKYGTREDMAMLAPLLSHSDPEVKRMASLVLHTMARDRGLPDPTVERSTIPVPREEPANSTSAKPRTKRSS